MTTYRISLRPATPADADLLRNLFAADKAAEFAAQGFPEAVYQPLIDMQYRGRAATYSAQHPKAVTWIIDFLLNCHPERSEEPASLTWTAAGQLVLEQTPQGSHVTDLAILPQYRNRGVATEVLQQLQQQAAAEGSSLHLRVEKQNPAFRLYARLGFKTIGEDELSFKMLWQETTT